MKKRILIKIGGLAFENEQAFQELAAGIKTLDANIAVVHGGGAHVSKALKAAGRGTTFIDGVRVTEAEDMAIVEDVLSGLMNAMIAARFAENGVAVERLSGKTEKLMVAEKILRNGRDIGHVGQIVKVNPEPVWHLFENNVVPIVSPVSADEHGNTFNVNADTAAAALAIGIQVTDLIYFSDVPGVLHGKKLIPNLTIESGEQLIKDGVISGGMVAKMEAIFNAIQHGVQQVHISQWQGSGTLFNLLHKQQIQQTIISA